MDYRPLIHESLQILSLLFLNPISSNLMQFYGKCVGVIVIGGLIDAGLYLNFNYQGIDSSVEVFIVIGLSQNFIKWLFLLSYKKEIMLLINNTNIFWKPNFCDFDQQEENNKILLFVKLCVKLYLALLLIICLLYLTKPLFLTESVDLPWKTCFSKFFSYNVCYAFEVLLAPIFILPVVGFDILYISVIINIICEFKLIESCFPNLKINSAVIGTDKEAMDELKKLIDHHNLILGCTKIMVEIYRGSMLGLFGLNMFGMCFSLIIITSSNSNNTTKLLFGMMAIFYLVQLFFYCICGSTLADESMKISWEVYNSKWWIKTQPELRKALIMIIRRSNKPEILTAGGLVQVNLQTFRMILRSTVSFFTFMQVIYGNSE